MSKEKVGKRHLRDLTELQAGMSKKTKTIQHTISFLLNKRSGQKKEIGCSSAKTSPEKIKEPKIPERTKLHDFQIDDSNIDSETSSFNSSSSPPHFIIVSFYNVDNSRTVRASTSKSSNTSSFSNEEEVHKDSCFEYFKRNSKGRNYVRCNLCQKQEATTKAFRNSKRIPALCTLEGTIPRKEILLQHLKSEMHNKAVEAEKVSHFSPPEKVRKTQLGSMINKSNVELKNKVAGLMINVFNDAKKLTLQGKLQI